MMAETFVRQPRRPQVATHRLWRWRSSFIVRRKSITSPGCDSVGAVPKGGPLWESREMPFVDIIIRRSQNHSS